MSGLRNLVVFGRSVTFVLQNLRHSVGREEFDAWYEPLQAKMREDELLRYLTTLGNAILKEDPYAQDLASPSTTRTPLRYFN